MKRIIVVRGQKLIYSPERHGYIDPEDHGGLTGRPERVWHVRRKIKGGHPHRRIHHQGLHPRHKWRFHHPWRKRRSIKDPLWAKLVVYGMGGIFYILLFAVMVAPIVCTLLFAPIFNLDKEECQVLAREAFDLINQYRVEVGEQELQWDDGYAELAQAWCDYMEETNDYRHSDYGWTENIVKHWGGNDGLGDGGDVVKPWFNSPFHALNLHNHWCRYGAVAVTEEYAVFLAVWGPSSEISEYIESLKDKLASLPR